MPTIKGKEHTYLSVNERSLLARRTEFTKDVQLVLKKIFQKNPYRAGNTRYTHTYVPYCFCTLKKLLGGLKDYGWS